MAAPAEAGQVLSGMGTLLGSALTASEGNTSNSQSHCTAFCVISGLLADAPVISNVLISLKAITKIFAIM